MALRSSAAVTPYQSALLLTYIPLSRLPSVFNPLNAELNPTRHLLALAGVRHFVHVSRIRFNPLNAELNPIRHLLALAGAHHFVHVSRIRFNPLKAELNPIRHLLTLAGARHFVDVSRIRVKQLHFININNICKFIQTQKAP
jgi:hypothetical protein